ncbi:RNA 2'-phosphotransferase [bacterium]|nr:MAG: RNA 2'-phosphotransferase [bacterium]
MNKTLTRISKKLSYILRHHPEAYGLTLDSDGFISLEELKNNTKIDRETIEKIIENQEKKRLEIVGDRVRALYGHSAMEMKYPEMDIIPPHLYHGTAPDNIARIIAQGLKPMSRKYVHLSEDKETALIVGKRHHKRPVVLTIKAQKAGENGIKFYRAGDVILCKFVPPEFISE